MTQGDVRRSPVHPNATWRVVGASLALVFSLAACNGAAPTPFPSDGPASAGSLPPASAAADPSSAAPGVGQTDTDWGRIWDELPEAFPVYPGAAPADEAATEAVSGTFALEGAIARTVVAWMQTELERAAYRTEALNGPFEDGSFILDLVGSLECRLQVAVAPLGGLTMVTVRYGAACPGP
jgi:hypothetical protein